MRHRRATWPRSLDELSGMATEDIQTDGDMDGLVVDLARGASGAAALLCLMGSFTD